MLHTIVFDLGRTLLDFDFARLNPSLNAYREQAHTLGLLHESGQLAPDEFRRRICALPGAGAPPLPASAAEFEAWWCSVFSAPPLVDEAWLQELRRRYRLGLLSNTGPIHFPYLRRLYPFLSGFDFQVLSYEVGAVKPEPAIYAAVERQAAGPPGGILYFDDIPEYVAAARARGWQAEVFHGEAAARAAVAEAAQRPA